MTDELIKVQCATCGRPTSHIIKAAQLRARLGTIRLPPFVEFSDADTACFVRHGDAVSGASVAWN